MLTAGCVPSFSSLLCAFGMDVAAALLAAQAPGDFLAAVQGQLSAEEFHFARLQQYAQVERELRNFVSLDAASAGQLLAAFRNQLWTREQLQDFTRLVAELAAGRGEAVVAQQASEASKRLQFQDYCNVLHYLGTGHWRVLLDPSVTQVAKLQLVCNHAAALGCRQPLETTSQFLAAVLISLPGSMIPAAGDISEYDKYQAFLVTKDQLHRACKQVAKDAAVGPAVLPLAPHELDPNLYRAALGEDSPGVSPYSIADLKLYASSIPMRKTHKAVAGRAGADNVLGNVLHALNQNLRVDTRADGGLRGFRLSTSSSEASQEPALQLRRGAAVVPVPRLASQPSLGSQQSFQGSQALSDLSVAQAATAPLALPAPCARVNLQSPETVQQSEEVMAAADLLALTMKAPKCAESSREGKQGLADEVPAVDTVDEGEAVEKAAELLEGDGQKLEGGEVTQAKSLDRALAPSKGRGKGKACKTLCKKPAAAENLGQSLQGPVARKKPAAGLLKRPSSGVGVVARKKPAARAFKRPSCSGTDVARKKPAAGALKRPAACAGGGSKQQPVEEGTADERKARRKGVFLDLSKKERLRRFGQGCSRCRWTVGCSKSCLVKLGYTLQG